MSLTKTKIKKRHGDKKQINNFSKLLKHDHRIYKNYNLDTLIIGLDEVGRGCVAGPVCTGAYSCSSFYISPHKLLSEIKKSQQETQRLSSLLLLDDSKKVAHGKRNILCESLLDVPCFDSNNHIFSATDLHSAQEIDQRGIVECIWSSMATNLINITLQYIELYRQYPPEIILLIDGPRKIANLTKLLNAKIQVNNYSDLELIEVDPNPEQQALNLNVNSKAIKLKQISITRGDSKSALIAAASNLAKQYRDKHMQELSEKYPSYLWHKNVGYGTKKHLEAINNHGLTDEHRKTFLSSIIN